MSLLAPLAPYKWAFIGTATAVLLVGVGYKGYDWGWRNRDRTFQAHLLEDSKQSARISASILRINQGTAKLSAAIIDERSKREKLQADLYQALKEKLYVFVPTNTPANEALHGAGGLPLGFVQHYNISLSGGDPGDTSRTSATSGDPTGIDLPEAAEVLASNNQVLNLCIGRLKDWDSWYDQLTTAFDEARLHEEELSK